MTKKHHLTGFRRGYDYLLQRTTTDRNGPQRTATDYNGPQRTRTEDNGPRRITTHLNGSQL